MNTIELINWLWKMVLIICLFMHNIQLSNLQDHIKELEAQKATCNCTQGELDK